MPWLVGMIVNGLSCLYLMAFGVIFCFPNLLPVTGANMNYTSVIVVGWTLLATIWLFCKRVTNDKVLEHGDAQTDDVGGEGVGPHLVKNSDT